MVTLINIELSAQSCADGTEFSLNENDFPQTCVTTDGTGGTPTTATFNHDFVTNTGGTYTGGADGTDDVMVSMDAVCSFPNGTNGTTQVGACLGPNGLDSSQSAGLNNIGTGTSDFSAVTVNDNPCANCWVEVCYDFINGFSSTADGFDVDWSSLNGSTEGLEASFGYVEGVDNTGAPFSPGVSAAGLSGYCHTQAQTLTASEFVTGSPAGGPLPPGVFGADEITGDGTATLCPTEEPGSSSGPNSTVSTGQTSGTIPANWGLNPDDMITKFCIVYLMSNSNADDCDGDGFTEVNTSPGGSLADVDFCVPPPACTFPEPTVTLQENCGFFDIIVGPIDESMASGTGTSVTYTTAPTGPPPVAGTPVTGTEQLPADGTTMYYIQIADAADPTCIEEFGPFVAPVGTPAPVLTVTCPPPIDICAGTTVPLGLTDSSGSAMAVYGGTCAAYVNTNGTATDVTDDFIDPDGAPVGSCMLTIQLVDANGCDSGTPEICTILFESNCDANGGEFPTTGP